MRTTLAASLLLATLSAANAHSVDVEPTDPSDRQEVAVESVFAPTRGFDDNDNIEFVVHGSLPNSCYTMAETFVRKLDDTTFEVRQFATKKDDGICAADAQLPIHLSMIVPFTKTVQLGRLKQANYRVQYWPVVSKIAASREIQVERAATATVDNMPYALVNGALAPVVVEAGATVKLALSGALNSSCTELGEIKVQRVDDTLIVLPTVVYKKGMVCMQVLRPFERTLDLGIHEAGHYLVHVRTMNGNSVNQVVEVTPQVNRAER